MDNNTTKQVFIEVAIQFFITNRLYLKEYEYKEPVKQSDESMRMQTSYKFIPVMVEKVYEEISLNAKAILNGADRFLEDFDI